TLVVAVVAVRGATVAVSTSLTAVARVSAPDVDDTSSSSAWPSSVWPSGAQPVSCAPASAPNSSSDVSDLNVGVFISLVSFGVVGVARPDRATSGPTRKPRIFRAGCVPAVYERASAPSGVNGQATGSRAASIRKTKTPEV